MAAVARRVTIAGWTCSLRCVAALAMVALFAALTAGPASAIPPFSRKYKISCAMCHDVVPHLNSFGEGYRRAGFRMPAGKDEELTKQETIPLGSEGTKQAYPKMIWPATIPGDVPIGLSLGHIFRYQRDVAGEPKHTGQNFNFGALGEIAELEAGGTLDETFSFFGQFFGGFGGFSTTRMFGSVYGVFGDEMGLNLRVGQFEPGLLEVSNFTKLTESGYAVLNPRLPGGDARIVGDNTFTIEPTQKGVEFFGFIGGDPDTAFNLGVVEGRLSGNNVENNRKDVYLHLDHKFIGDSKLGYHMDGTPATTAPVKSSPGRNVWGDAQSATVGAFLYDGATTLDAATRQLDEFRYYGANVTFMHNNFNANAALTRRDHDRPDVGKAFGRYANIWSLEGDYAWFPWLVSAIRFETFDQQEQAGDPSSRDYRRAVLALQYVPRANVNVTLGSDLVDRTAESGGFEMDNVTLAFFVGF